MDFNSESETAYKNTLEYKQKRKEIIQEINSKYLSLKSAETNVFKRIQLWFHKQSELRRALSKLESKEILFFSNQF